MHMGKKPERKHGPQQAESPRRHDHGQGRRQAAPPAAQADLRTHPSPGNTHSRRTRPRWTADGPPPRPTVTHAPPAPPRSTAGPRPRHPAQIPPTASHSPTEPGQRTPRHDARRQRPRRPGRPQDPPRHPYYINAHHRRHPAMTPDSGPRWTTGPAADSTPDVITARMLLVIDLNYIYGHKTGQL